MKLPFLLAAAALALTVLLSPAEGRVVIDMRGKAVTVPDDPASIATIDDGFIEGVMTHLGVIKRVKVIGSWSMKRDYRYSIPSSSGSTFEYRGWNTMKYLHPWLNDLPCVNSPQGNIISYETLALAAPDVVLMRVGDTPVGTDREKVQKTVDTIEALGLPLIVLYSPTWFRSSDLSSMKTEVLEVDAGKVASWEQGYLVFSGADFAAIASAIERKYNVKIYYDAAQGSSLQEYFVKFRPDETLEETMDVMTMLIDGSRCRIDGDRVFFYF